MSKEIRLIVDAVSHEKDISTDIVFEALEAALVSASKKRYGMDQDFRISIDKNSGEHQTFRRWTVVESEERTEDEPPFNPEAELTLEQAQERNPSLKVGDVIEEAIESVEFGRIAAQTAKQVILQRLRSAKRDKILEEYKSRIGELIVGIVKKVTREHIILDVNNNAEAILRRSEMIPREIFRVGDRVRAYLYDVCTEARGPQLFLSRSCPEMLIELFKIEVPEIGDGSIEIKGAVRDAGSRAKVAVLAKDNRIDPIGACVGMRRSRITAVSTELNNERVDIILWNENPAQFVINAIAPAEVVSIVVDEERNVIDVVVAEDQLSQAIGRNGQNVRLASQLTGWILNIISETQALDRQGAETARLLRLFRDEMGAPEEVAESMVEEGFTTIEEIAYVPDEELLAVPLMTDEVLKALRDRAKTMLLTQAMTGKGGTPEADLLGLDGMDSLLAEMLAKEGIRSREDLAELSVEELLSFDNVDEDKAAKLIMQARAPWFEA